MLAHNRIISLLILATAINLTVAGASGQAANDGRQLLRLLSNGSAAEVESFMNEHHIDPSVAIDCGSRKVIPMWSAASGERIEIIKLLLNKGGDPNMVCDGVPLLHLPCRNGCDLVAQELLVHGARHDVLDHQGRSALQIAAGNGMLPTVERLLKAGSDPMQVDGRGRTALHVAAMKGKNAIIERLVKVRPECLHVIDHYGWNVLHYAAAYDHPAVVSTLLNALDPAASMQLKDLADKRTVSGKTPLHFSTMRGSYNLSRFLVAWDCDRSLRDCRGFTALDYVDLGDKLRLSQLLRAKYELELNPSSKVPIADESESYLKNSKLILRSRMFLGQIFFELRVDTSGRMSLQGPKGGQRVVFDDRTAASIMLEIRESGVLDYAPFSEQGVDTSYLELIVHDDSGQKCICITPSSGDYGFPDTNPSFSLVDGLIRRELAAQGW